mmetsp:Transcript_42655/g.89519  ORF Transcript_42655/g.89519 Transcript_42655/m.89519 type:complete len:109 (-) Transcript_42655:28-354(-)
MVIHRKANDMMWQVHFAENLWPVDLTDLCLKFYLQPRYNFLPQGNSPDGVFPDLPVNQAQSVIFCSHLVELCYNCSSIPLIVSSQISMHAPICKNFQFVMLLKDTANA